MFCSVDLNGADIERDVTDWWKSSYRLSKSLEDEFPAAAECAARLREDTTAFREHLPVIQVDCLPSYAVVLFRSAHTSCLCTVTRDVRGAHVCAMPGSSKTIL